MKNKRYPTNPHPPTNPEDGWPGQLPCMNCGYNFDRKPSGPPGKFGSVACRVAHHRLKGKAAIDKAFNATLRHRARH